MKIINKSKIRGLKIVGEFMKGYLEKKGAATVYLLGIKKNSATSCGYALHYRVVYRRPKPIIDFCDAVYTNKPVPSKRIVVKQKRKDG